MDEINRKILALLAQNADVPVTQISAAVGLSVPAVNKRIQKLRQDGVIQRFTVLTDARQVGKTITAFILVVLKSSGEIQKLLDYVARDADVLECYAVTGEYDYILKVCVTDVQALEDKLLCLKRKNGVVKSHTMLSLMEYKFQPAVLPAEEEHEG